MIIEELVKCHDDTFLEQYIANQKIKGKVKVLLQGDGGDEFFGLIYNTIKNISKWKCFLFLPKLIKNSGTRYSKDYKDFLNAINHNEINTLNLVY